MTLLSQTSQRKTTNIYIRERVIRTEKDKSVTT